MSNKSLHDDRLRGGMRTNGQSGNNKTACVDVGRVFDSCSDRDCIEGLRVYFTECDQRVIDTATVVRAKKAKVLGTCIDVDELPFQEGCYSCKLTFFVEVSVEVCGACGNTADILRGCTVFEKKVVLYGGEGTVQVFSGEVASACAKRCELANSGAPRCCVQVAEPVVLDACLVEACSCHRGACGCASIPESVCSCFACRLCEDTCDKTVVVTLGLFTIVQMIRNTQMLIPVYDYCVPCKDCNCDEESPCDLFKKMSFPIDDFFPPMNKRCGGK